MRRLWTYFIVGTIATAGGTAFAGGLPGSDSTASGGSTEQATAEAPAATASADSGSAAASGTSQTASSAASTAAATDTSGTRQTASAASDDGGVETGSFVAIEDDPLIIDASSVVDGDGVGSMQVQWLFIILMEAQRTSAIFKTWEQM